MTLSYQSLDLELLPEGIISILSVHVCQRLNEHGKAQVKALVEEEKAAALVEQADDSFCVRIVRNDDKKQNIFCGQADRAEIVKEGGLYYLYLDFCGYTKEWDRTEKSQSFCRKNDSYKKVIEKVLSEYGQKEIRDEVTGGSKIPEMLMQYEETDWTFLKRLASHFSSFLVADDTQPFGKVYFGIPDLDHGAVLDQEEYSVILEQEKYNRMEAAEAVLTQEMMDWQVRSYKQLQMGEQVTFRNIKTVVTAVDVLAEKGNLIFEYVLSRRKGVLTEKKYNPRIEGMSIPATVKERTGNQIRVHFDIDPAYEAADDLKYFTFAIETSNFYCMPEEESRVHIYFPDQEERNAYAVHAVSMSGAGENAQSGNGIIAAGNPADGSGGAPQRNSAAGTGSAGAGQNTSGSASIQSGNVGNSSWGNFKADGNAGVYFSKTSAAGQTVSAAGKSAQKKTQDKDPSHKKFSDPSGSYMELEPGGITFSAAGGTAVINFTTGGNLFIQGHNLFFSSDASILAGADEGGRIPRVYLNAKKTVRLFVRGGKNNILLDDSAIIQSRLIKKEAELKNAALPSADSIRSQLTSGDAGLRDAANSGMKDMLMGMAAKQKAAEQKTRSGLAGVGIAVGVMVLIAFSGGLAAIPLSAALGVTGLAATVTTVGVANTLEGISDVEKVQKGDLSKSRNLVRDTPLFGGSQEKYAAFSMIANMTFGMAVGTSMGMMAASQNGTGPVVELIRLCQKNQNVEMAVSIAGDVSAGMINDWVDEGKADPVHAVQNACFGAVKGYNLQYLRSLTGVYIGNQNLAAGANILAGIGAGTATDYWKSLIMQEPFSMPQSLMQNAAEVSTVEAIDAYGRWVNKKAAQSTFGDPVDAVSGTFLMQSADLILPDILSPVRMVRSYQSTNLKSGWLGKGWHFFCEGRLCFDADTDTLHAQLPDGYCAAFCPEQAGDGKGGYIFRDRIANNRYSLTLEIIAEEWVIADTHLHKQYRYDRKGLLQSVEDKNGNIISFGYRNDIPEKMITPLGNEVRFWFKNGRLVKLTDDEGRSVQYCYEKDCLARVEHMDGGITRYLYSEDGLLIKALDQTGQPYVENAYDEKGRVLMQKLADGNVFEAEYLDQKRQVCVRQSAHPGVKCYTCDESMQLTQVRYPDGSTLQYGYDIFHNRISETDRLGRTVRKEYDGHGHLLRKTSPGGFIISYVYDENGNLAGVSDSAGRECRYTYDANHNLISRKEKVSDSHWIQKSYRYDSVGRLTAEQDGNGNVTEYRYEALAAYPYCTIYPDGNEVHCVYDRLGRKLLQADGAGKTEYAYNKGNYLTMVRDGEGNEAHRLYDGAGRVLAFYSPAQWKEKDRSHTSYQYDAFDRLTDIIYPDGSHARVIRDGEGNILKKIHPNAYDDETKDGEGICCDYDGENRLLRIHYPDGGVERFFYDAAGNRVKHVLPEQYERDADDGAGRIYTYDETDRLTSVTGPDGVREAVYEYDLLGKCVRKTDEKGIHAYYRYDLVGNLVQKLEPTGRDAENVRYCQTLYEYDDNGNKIKETRCGGSYSKDGSLLEKGEDLALTFIYDVRNRLIRVEDGRGAGAAYQYDVKGNRISEEQTINGGDAETGRKPVVRRIRYAYDRAGRMIKKTEILDSGLLEDNGVSPRTAVTRYVYDENGNRILIVMPEGCRISRRYDERDRLVRERVEDRENGIDRRTHFAYDHAGNVISVRQESADGKAREIRYDYDLKDRLTRIAHLDGPVVEASYDSNDRIVGRKRLLPAQEESWQESAFAYDLLGNLTEQRRADGILLKQNEYDRRGNRIRRVDGDGVEVCCRYGLQDERTEVFTKNSSQLGKAAQKLTCNARGQITGIEDGCGGQTAFELDYWGRITAVHTAEGGREAYAYDYAGNITETVDANGGRIRYAYNSQGKVCAVTDQSGNTETFRYDKEGRCIAHKDRNGTLIQTSYNADGNKTMQVCTDKDGRRQIMGSWEYDSFGQLKKSVAGGFCYTYEYRPDGKLLRKRSSGKLIVSCAYYRDGSLKSLTDVTGRSTRYEYDCNGRPAVLKDDAGKVIAEYVYTPAGRIKEIRTPGGMGAAYTYDGDGSLIRLILGDPKKGKFLYDAEMTYDLNGNRIRRNGFRSDADGRHQEMATIYRYDPMNRLTEENRKGEGEKYVYDLNGNRIRREHFKNGVVDAEETYCYNERNKLTQKRDASGLLSCLYDANGNLLSERSEKGGSEYRYDLLNRQTYVNTLTGQEQENLYDGEGLRAGIVENGQASFFQFHNGEILTECNGESAPIRRHISGPCLSHVQTLQDDAYHMYHQDEQGSTAYITDPEGNMENSYLYDAFGNILESRELIPNRMLYTGQQYDQAAGQYYLRARYYNPVLGRFTQEDVYRGDGLNLYAYCANNPVMYYDPSGYDKQSAWQVDIDETEAGKTEGYQSWVVGDDVGEGAGEKKDSLLSMDLQFFAGESGSDTTRVGRWMSQDEYDKMVSTGKVQMSGDNKVHVANPADINAFGKQAPKGSLYVEFDVPSNTISKGGTDGWGIINGPGSLLDRLNAKKDCLELQKCRMLPIYQSKGVSNMSDYNYEIIKAAVLEWYEKVLSELINQYEIVLSKNNEDALIIDFDFQNCMAQLSVTNSQYVPYQFVYFEAMGIDVSDSEETTPIYSFYDDDTMKKNDVISALDEALLFCSNYKVK